MDHPSRRVTIDIDGKPVEAVFYERAAMIERFIATLRPAD
jgi:hypothetical protein